MEVFRRKSEQVIDTIIKFFTIVPTRSNSHSSLSRNSMLLCISLLLLSLSVCVGTTRLASSVSETCEESTICGEVSGLHLKDRVAIIKAQHDLSDAIITYRSSGTNSFESAARTRRVEYSRRAAFSDSQAIARPAVQQQLAAAIAHQLNADIALTRVLPLNLPPEEISYPFHSFW